MTVYSCSHLPAIYSTIADVTLGLGYRGLQWDFNFASSSSGTISMRYVLPVLWMPSCFRIMAAGRYSSNNIAAS